MADYFSFLHYKYGQKNKWGVIPNEGELVFELIGDIYGEWQIGGKVGHINELEVLPPCEPRTISGLAYNYKDLVGFKDEYEEPLVFLKAVSALASATDQVVVPKSTESIWAEVEIALVLKKPLFNATREDAREAILGCTVANDITAKNVYGRDHHLARSKSRFTFCPVGAILRPWYAEKKYNMRTTINGHETQSGKSSNRILDDLEALMLISSIFPLAPGDLVLTGTPAGALDSTFSSGDDVRLEIDGLGVLNNPIISQN